METSEDREKEKSIAQQQLDIMKKQLWYSRVTALVAVAILAVVIVGGSIWIPKLTRLLDDTNVIVNDLQEANLSETVKNINELTVTSQASILDATEKLDSIDLESLNTAIGDLKTIIEQVAQLLDKIGL